jgi:hypothetical protein
MSVMTLVSFLKVLVALLLLLLLLSIIIYHQPRKVQGQIIFFQLYLRKGREIPRNVSHIVRKCHHVKHNAR